MRRKRARINFAITRAKIIESGIVDAMKYKVALISCRLEKEVINRPTLADTGISPKRQSTRREYVMINFDVFAGSARPFSYSESSKDSSCLVQLRTNIVRLEGPWSHW